jgi:hypothetical protein
VVTVSAGGGGARTKDLPDLILLNTIRLDDHNLAKQRSRKTGHIILSEQYASMGEWSTPIHQ